MDHTIKIHMKSNTRTLCEDQIQDIKNAIFNYLLHDFDFLFETSYNLNGDDEVEIKPIELEVS